MPERGARPLVPSFHGAVAMQRWVPPLEPLVAEAEVTELRSADAPPRLHHVRATKPASCVLGKVWREVQPAMKTKRQEVFTAGCPVCEAAVRLVHELACPECEVIVYDLHEGDVEKARQYGINTLPTVVVDGRLVSCCEISGPRREDLEAAGIGRRLE